ncbi:MAG: hypothetical protein AAGI06_10790, partial [Pseudomonadota bacterium]
WCLSLDISVSSLETLGVERATALVSPHIPEIVAVSGSYEWGSFPFREEKCNKILLSWNQQL